MSGKVVPATEGARPPARLRIHLVPAEAGNANDVLRYAEALSRSDGAFSLSNIAPGKYWLIARAAPYEEMSDSSPAPIAWETHGNHPYGNGPFQYYYLLKTARSD